MTEQYRGKPVSDSKPGCGTYPVLLAVGIVEIALFLGEKGAHIFYWARELKDRLAGRRIEMKDISRKDGWINH